MDLHFNVSSTPLELLRHSCAKGCICDSSWTPSQSACVRCLVAWNCISHMTYTYRKKIGMTQHVRHEATELLEQAAHYLQKIAYPEHKSSVKESTDSLDARSMEK